MVLGVIIARIKAALICILTLIKRSLCCFRRRRKSSVDSVPLTTVGVIPNYQDKAINSQDANWGTWEENAPPQTIEEHIQLYRSKANQGIKQDPQEPATDYFQDMEPDIRKQTKVILKPRETSSNRLAFTADIIPSGDSELESWEENEKRRNEWAEAEEWDADGILREKRKEEHRKKMMEREQRRTLGSKLS